MKNQKQIITTIFELKIQSAKFEKWGMNVLKGLGIFLILKIIASILDGNFNMFFYRIFLHTLNYYFLSVTVSLWSYAAFLRQKQNLLFKELELLIKHQIEFPTT